MSRRRSFRYRAEGNQVFVIHVDHASGHETEYPLCTVSKKETSPWAAYIAERMELTESLMVSGLTKKEIHALARMVYEHYKPEGEKS